MTVTAEGAQDDGTATPTPEENGTTTPEENDTIDASGPLDADGETVTVTDPQSTAEPIDVFGSLPFSYQVALTIGLIAIIVGVRYLARRWHRSGPESSTLELLVSAGVAVVTGAGIVLLIDLWNQLGVLYHTLQNMGDTEFAGRVLVSVVVLGATYALTSFVGRAIQTVAGAEETISEHQREIVYRLTQLSLYAVAILLVISLFTGDLGSLLVGAGFLGIIVGMAARQTLGAVLAGFVLMFNRPFEIGDWVEVGDNEGIVTDITVVNTRVQTFDGEIVTIPNGEVSASPITNRTRKGRLRIEVEVGVDYDDDVRRAADVALETVEDLDETMDVPTPQVVMKSFGDSAVVLGVRFWIDRPSSRRRWRARTAVIGALKSAFEAEGIEIPFPQRELASRPEEGGFRLAGESGRAREASTADGGEERGDGAGTESER